MKNIYLIGMPGCGKSTIGKIISREMNMKFVDLDAYIVESTGKSVEEMFTIGERYFRTQEAECLKKTALLTDTVVATGGGVVEMPINADTMKNSGTVVFIDTPVRNILSNSSLSGRPLLADNKNKIFELYERRYDKYVDAADVVVLNNGTVDEITEKIISSVFTK
ncbi:MAG: shikimate kinase [Ruminococcaceae bacterium]|nr:shikimate kinase [Oscillospiraceae bacterium]